MPNAGSAPSRFEAVLVRHGETEWSVSGRHTGVKDIPLTEAGRETARRLGARLASRTFAEVWTSPRVRAVETCELAGFGHRAKVVPEIAEWDYGEYEGRTTDEIRSEHPGWTLWTHGCPGGESATEVGSRADRVIPLLRALPGSAVLFSHGHFLRVLAARWIALWPEMGMGFALATGAISMLGWERSTAVIRSWNDHRQFDAG